MFESSGEYNEYWKKITLHMFYCWCSTNCCSLYKILTFISIATVVVISKCEIMLKLHSIQFECSVLSDNSTVNKFMNTMEAHPIYTAIYNEKENGIRE